MERGVWYTTKELGGKTALAPLNVAFSNRKVLRRVRNLRPLGTYSYEWTLA